MVAISIEKKKVIIVSPTTLFAYFQTVLQGLKALHIEEAAKKIGERVLLLQKHLESYDTHFKKVGVHLGTTVNMYNAAYKELKKVDKDMLKITGEDMGIEPLSIEVPENDL
jgi:DNA recombination protein RmuC